MPGLEDLGWLQFERLCELVLEADAGVDPMRWEGSADDARQLVCEDELELNGRALEPPVLIRCLWSRGAEAAPPPSRYRSVVTFANRPLGGDVVYGEQELFEAIRRLPALRMKLPSILSLDAAPPDPGALGHSTIDIDATRALAKVFVPTPAWQRAVAILRAHHFLVLTGPPEMGKTAIARMLGLALLTEGWEVHECTRPDQVERRFDPSRPQLFIADDAFGSTEYRPDSAERWAANLDRILKATDDHHWLAWTSRPAPLRAALRRLHRERGAERFPQPAAVQVDAAALGPEEKTLILFRHARAADLPEDKRAFIRRRGAEIVEHPHFTPERIRRFIARGAPEDGLERELSEPTAAMAASYRALDPEHRELLLAMLDSPPGPVAERDLAAALRRHVTTGCPKAPADLVDRPAPGAARGHAHVARGRTPPSAADARGARADGGLAAAGRPANAARAGADEGARLPGALRDAAGGVRGRDAARGAAGRARAADRGARACRRPGPGAGPAGGERAGRARAARRASGAAA